MMTCRYWNTSAPSDGTTSCYTASIDTETIPPPLHLDKPILTPEMV